MTREESARKVFLEIRKELEKLRGNKEKISAIAEELEYATITLIKKYESCLSSQTSETTLSTTTESIS